MQQAQNDFIVWPSHSHWQSHIEQILVKIVVFKKGLGHFEHKF